MPKEPDQRQPRPSPKRELKWLVEMLLLAAVVRTDLAILLGGVATAIAVYAIFFRAK